MTAIRKTGPVGRVLRLFVGGCLVVIAAPVYLRAGWRYDLSSLGLVAGLVIFYMLMHHAISLYARKLNRWVGTVLAIAPVVLVWYFGQGGGPLFGQGQGGTAAITYIAVSLLIDAARADAGCEVMAIPGMLTGSRTHLPCLMFSPIDRIEAAASQERRPG